MHTYQFTVVSRKQLRKLPKDIQRRIIKKLDFYCAQEDPLRFADSLIYVKIGRYRFRIGDYRVIFDVKETVLIIHIVGSRRDIYRSRTN